MGKRAHIFLFAVQYSIFSTGAPHYLTRGTFLSSRYEVELHRMNRHHYSTNMTSLLVRGGIIIINLHLDGLYTLHLLMMFYSRKLAAGTTRFYSRCVTAFGSSD